VSGYGRTTIVRAAVRIIPSHEKWPTEADPSSVPGDIRQRFQKQFSRPMTGHTPRKLPFFNAISRIIAVHAQNLPTRARLWYHLFPHLSSTFSEFFTKFCIYFRWKQRILLSSVRVLIRTRFQLQFAAIHI